MYDFVGPKEDMGGLCFHDIAAKCWLENLPFGILTWEDLVTESQKTIIGFKTFFCFGENI